MLRLAFKPKTNDMREAPSRVLIEQLWDAGTTVKAFDPEANEGVMRIYRDGDSLVLAESVTDALAIQTEWEEFRSPDLAAIKNELSEPVIFDGRNIYDPDAITGLGIRYYGISKRGKEPTQRADSGPIRVSAVGQSKTQDWTPTGGCPDPHR